MAGDSTNVVFNDEHTIQAEFQVPASDVQAGVSGNVTLTANLTTVAPEFKDYVEGIRDEVEADRTEVAANLTTTDQLAYQADQSAKAANDSQVAAKSSEDAALLSEQAAKRSETASAASEQAAANSAAEAAVDATIVQAAVDDAMQPHLDAVDPHPQYAQETAVNTALAGKVGTNDVRLTNSREWTADTVSQVEAEEGTGTARRAWSSLRVRQAVNGWWNTSSAKTDLAGKLDSSQYALPPAPKRLLIYYGYPAAYKGLWDVQQVVNAIAANYDIWICGDTYQDPLHESYAETQQIITGLLALGVEVWGYIPLGTTSYNLSITDITTRIGQWDALGITGIFIDEFGFDYGNDRQRQIDAVNACHSAGLPYCANAWVWEEVSVDNVADLPADWAVDDWRRVSYEALNPSNLPLPRNSTDAYLLENWGMDSNGPATKWDFHERATLTQASNPDGMRMWAVAVMPENPEGTLDTTLAAPFGTADAVNEYVTVAGYVHGMDCVGVNGFSFGSGGTTTFETPRLPLPDSFRGKVRGTPKFDTTNGEAKVFYGELSLSCTTEEIAGIYTWEVSDVDYLGKIPLENDGYLVVKQSDIPPIAPVEGQLWKDSKRKRLASYEDGRWVSYTKKPVADKMLRGQHNLWCVLVGGRVFTSSASNGQWSAYGTGRGVNNNFYGYGVENLFEVIIPSLSPVKDVGGNGHTVWALTEVGELFTWGRNAHGQIGDGTTSDRAHPYLCLTDIAEVFDTQNRGYQPSQTSMWVRKFDNTIWCWGENSDGELGLGNVTSTVSTPVQSTFCGTDTRYVLNMGGYAGWTLIQKQDNRIYVTGWNTSGHLGRGNTSGTTGTWVDVTTAWGSDTRGPIKMGRGTTTYYDTAVTNLHACLLLFENGDLLTCGNNKWGQLGKGSTGSVTMPVEIMTGVTGYLMVANSGPAVCAVLNLDGSYYVWGYNGSGQQGNGTTSPVLSPTLVFDDVVDSYLDMNNAHTYGHASTHIIKRDLVTHYEYWSCGWSEHGCTGQGTSAASVTSWGKMGLPLDADIKDIAHNTDGTNVYLACTHDGRWFAWGYNGRSDITTPVHAQEILSPINVKPPNL